jgi:hypothetical protein
VGRERPPAHRQARTPPDPTGGRIPDRSRGREVRSRGRQSRTGKPPPSPSPTTSRPPSSTRPTSAGIVCDESSAIKAFDGTTRAVVTELMREMPYRLLGTATAAPNDYLELGTSSEALGELGYTDMLSRFFVNDNRTVTSRSNFAASGRSVGWRFKGHAEEPFWRWVSSWARAIRKPSDYGYDDGAFTCRTGRARARRGGHDGPRGDAVRRAGGRPGEEREENRRTLDERCERAATYSTERGGRAVAWCHLNDESPASPNSSTEPSKSPDRLARREGREATRVLPRRDSRPRDQAVIGAWGLNWQHAHRMTYFPSHSYEQYYQAVRRMWRFGQQLRGPRRRRDHQGRARTSSPTSSARRGRRRSCSTQLIAHMNDALQGAAPQRLQQHD